MNSTPFVPTSTKEGLWVNKTPRADSRIDKPKRCFTSYGQASEVLNYRKVNLAPFYFTKRIFNIDTMIQSVGRQAAVALIGPVRWARTRWLLAIGQDVDSLYLDLEGERADRAKLADPVLFLRAYQDRLVIQDEVHRVPELFQDLRGLIDRRRRAMASVMAVSWSSALLLVGCPALASKTGLG